MENNYIRERSIGREVRPIRRDFTTEELNILREQFTEAALKKSDVEEEKREATRQFNVELKELSSSMSDLAQSIRNRFEERDVECYMVPNYETGMLEFYDVRTNEEVDSRKLRPNERQLTIMQAAAA